MCLKGLLTWLSPPEHFHKYRGTPRSLEPQAWSNDTSSASVYLQLRRSTLQVACYFSSNHVFWLRSSLHSISLTYSLQKDQGIVQTAFPEFSTAFIVLILRTIQQWESGEALTHGALEMGMFTKCKTRPSYTKHSNSLLDSFWCLWSNCCI
jgi:hypothetical protein